MKTEKEKINERAKDIIESFKKEFEAMSYEEREKYLKRYGFSFGQPEQKSKEVEPEQESSI